MACMHDFVGRDVERISHHEKESGTAGGAPSVGQVRSWGLSVDIGDCK